MDEKVMIGDYLGTIEEFMPGEGTFAEDGKIYASKIGYKVVDLNKHLAEVRGKKIPKLDVGQVIFGEVTQIKNSQVMVIAGKIKGRAGMIDEKTMIYVSNIADKYVERPTDMFAIGDIVKAEVIRIDNNLIDISTKGDYGVVRAFCKRCRLPLGMSKKYAGKLECNGCGHVETRKIATDYAKVAEV